MQAIDIILFATVLSLLSALLTRRLGGGERLKAAQQEIKRYQEELRAAIEKRDEGALAALKAKEARIASLTKEVLLTSLKSTALIAPIFLIALWAAPLLWPNFSIKLPIALHLNEVFSLQIFKESTYGARGFFILCVVVIGIVIEGVLRALKR